MKCSVSHTEWEALHQRASSGRGFKKPTVYRLGDPGGSPLPQSDVLSLGGGRLEGGAGGESEPLVVVSTLALFEEAFVEQLRAARPPLVLQAEQQVPEVDSGDALTHELPGAGPAGAAGLRGS